MANHDNIEPALSDAVLVSRGRGADEPQAALCNKRSRGRSRFTQADVTRAIRGAMLATLPIAAVRIEPDGSILIVPGNRQTVASLEANPWDE